MIQIAGKPFQLTGSLGLGSVEKAIAERMLAADALYAFPSVKELLFEIGVRKNMIESAREMAEGQAAFTTFQYAQCNPEYWKLTNAGGFLLKRGISPSEAIQNIYSNSSLYAFECATACVITFYSAVKKSINKTYFDSVFQDLYLYSWHTDPNLGMYTFYGDHFLPGDVVYFNNPDYSRETPWYRGINAVKLESGEYFGHGLGVMSEGGIIEFLNSVRKPESNRPAYLTDLVTRLSYSSFAGYGALQRNGIKGKQFVIHHNKCSISSVKYLYYLNKGLSKGL